MRVALFFILALLLCGCGINRGMVNPFSYAPKSSSSYWQDSEFTQQARSSKNEALEKTLPSPELTLSLAEVIDIGLKNSPETQLTWIQAREAATIYGQSQSPLLPSLDIGFNYQRERASFLASQVEQNVTKNFLITSTTSQWGPQLNLSYTIFDFGERRAESEAARYALYFANYTHNRSIQTLIETIASDYYDYLYQKQLLKAYEADLFTAQETLDAAELSLKKGVKDVSDVLQAKTHWLQTEIKLVAQQQELVTSRATLLEDMGLPANYCINVQNYPDTEADLSLLLPLDQYIDLAFCCRPDYIAAKAEVQSKIESLKAANRQILPVVDYSLEFGRTYFTGGFHNDYDFTSILSVSMPLFAGFYYRNTIKNAEENKKEAETKAVQLELDIIKQVTVSHSAVKVAHDTLLAAKQLYDSAQEQYEISLSKYRTGTNSILDVVSAQSSLADARAEQANALKQWFTSLATLAFNSGIISKNPKDHL